MAFHPLRAGSSSNMLLPMTDPFRTVAIRERLVQALWLAVLIAFIGSGSLLYVELFVTDARMVRAQVLRVGMYSAGDSSGGDLPILTVMLPDGSIRQVTPSWSAVDNCLPGRWISLQQRGTFLKIALPGCSKTR
jgi:hypothetical protein